MAWMSRVGFCAIISSIAFVSVLSSSSCPLAMICRSFAVSRGVTGLPSLPADEAVGDCEGPDVPTPEGPAVGIVWSAAPYGPEQLGGSGWDPEAAPCGLGCREPVPCGGSPSGGFSGLPDLDAVLHDTADFASSGLVVLGM